MKRGSALLMALWTIMVLGVIVISFAFEAKLQGGINIYVQGRKRVQRLLESGKVIGEAVLLGYENCKDPDLSSGTPDWDDIFEDEDRWCKEKYELKNSSKCTIGPILLDETEPDSGTVTIELSMSHNAGEGGININSLYKDGDNNFEDRWRIILDKCGVPRDEINDEDGKAISLQSYVISSWQDYRDEDDNTYAVSDNSSADVRGYQPEKSGEKEEYEEYYDDHKDDFAEEDRFEPANCEIADLHELSRVMCFRRFPALLTGGVLNPWADKEEQIELSQGLLGLGIFGVSGSEKVNVNDCTVNELLTIPGIFDVDELDDGDMSESQNFAEAIVKCRSIMPEDDDNIDKTRDWWPYKDWNDLRKRVEDEFPDVELSSDDAAKYLVFKPESTTVFQMKITANLMDMEYTAECECYVKDKKIRYISWKEN